MAYTYKGKLLPEKAFVKGMFFSLLTFKTVKGALRNNRKPQEISPNGPFIYGNPEEISEFIKENRKAASPKADAIRFYKKTDKYFEFSNFYNALIVIDGIQYMNTEQFFQSQKFCYPKGMEYCQIIISADSPAKVKMLGSQNPKTRFGKNWVVNKETDQRKVVDVIHQYENIKIRPDWEQVKEDVMKVALKAKFDQHPKLKRLLVSTGKQLISEASPRDSYWGTGKDGKGLNRLGVLLMELRDSY